MAVKAEGRSVAESVGNVIQTHQGWKNVLLLKSVSALDSINSNFQHALLLPGALVRPFAFLAFLLLLSCGGGSSSPSGGPNSLPAPTNLVATWDPQLDQFDLTWIAPSGSFDGYDLEVAFPGGSYTKINQTVISSNYTDATLSVTTLPPELSIIDFRIWAVRNGADSSCSNIAVVPIPLATPVGLSAHYDPSAGGVSVNWGTTSLVADRYLLERASADAAGNPQGTWSTLPLPSAIVSGYVDTSTAESQNYLYRVSAWKGTVSSATAGPVKVVIPPYAPTSFSAQTQPSAVALSWVNQSKTATQIQIIRSPGPNGTNPLATLPASATSYLDSNLPLGYYTYQINVSDGVSTTLGPTLQAAPANPLGTPILVTSSQPALVALLPVPMNPIASAMSLTGGWAVETGQPLTVYAAPWGGWYTWKPSDAYTIPTECLSLDSQSQPHSIYLRQNSSIGGSDLVHGWFDGNVWQTEVVQTVTPTPFTATLAFHLDSTGNAQTLQDTGANGTAIEGLVYSYKSAGNWIHENLKTGTSYDGYSGTPVLYLDPSYTPHVLVPTWSNMQEFTRNSDGSWSSQILPNIAPFGGAYSYEGAVWADGNNAWVFYEEMDLSNPQNDALFVLQKAQGTWLTPIQLKSYPHSGQPQGSVALSRDGTRVAMVTYTTFGLSLFTQSPQGWQESLLPFPPAMLYYPYYKVAFDGGNRMHVLVKPSGGFVDIEDCHE